MKSLRNSSDTDDTGNGSLFGGFYLLFLLLAQKYYELVEN